MNAGKFRFLLSIEAKSESPEYFYFYVTDNLFLIWYAVYFDSIEAYKFLPGIMKRKNPEYQRKLYVVNEFSGTL